MQDGRDVLIG